LNAAQWLEAPRSGSKRRAVARSAAQWLEALALDRTVPPKAECG